MSASKLERVEHILGIRHTCIPQEGPFFPREALPPRLYLSAEETASNFDFPPLIALAKASTDNQSETDSQTSPNDSDNRSDLIHPSLHSSIRSPTLSESFPQVYIPQESTENNLSWPTGSEYLSSEEAQWVSLIAGRPLDKVRFNPLLGLIVGSAYINERQVGFWVFDVQELYSFQNNRELRPWSIEPSVVWTAALGTDPSLLQWDLLQTWCRPRDTRVYCFYLDEEGLTPYSLVLFAPQDETRFEMSVYRLECK